MKVDVKGLINQLKSLSKRIECLQDMLDEAEENDEETIEIYAVRRLLEWSDMLNIEIACDGLEQAYLDEDGNEK